MFKSRILRGLTLLVFISAIGFLVTSAPWSRAGEQSARAGKTKELAAEEAYQNIQVLKGIPSSHVMSIMRLMSASLGVECFECHREGDYDKDVRPSKEIARKMLRMVFEINRTNFKGRPQVTCNTCHRGQKQPVPTPGIIQPGWRTRPSKTPLPAIEQIIEQYARAVGGRSRFENFKGCVLKGSRTGPQGTLAPIEISYVEPGRMSITAAYQFGAGKAPDGKLPVIRLPNGLFRSEVGPSEMKRYEHLIHPIRLVEAHRNPRVIGKVKLGESETYEVVASVGGLTATLFFDTRTGLLLRRVVNIRNTVIGPVPEQSDFEDYREVDGVRLPFVTRESGLAGATMLKLVEIKHDVAAKGEPLDPNAKVRR